MSVMPRAQVTAEWVNTLSTNSSHDWLSATKAYKKT